MSRRFEVEDNTPGPVPLLIGLMGAPGAGKTFSALTLAEGMRTPATGRPVLIDTERGRSRKYRDAFDFQRIDFAPPFKPTDFLEAIHQALKANPCAVIVDSLSDEHEGEGGVLDWHDAEVPKMSGNEFAAWKKPKDDRRTMINGLLQIMTPMIFCFRAREKVKQLVNERGKNVPTNIGYQPIAPLEIVHALDLNVLLPPKSDGRPIWRTDKIGEDFVIKQPAQFKALFGAGQPLTKRIGAELASWARGEMKTLKADHEAVLKAATRACEEGHVTWGQFWRSASSEEKASLKPHLEGLKKILERGDVADPLAERDGEQGEAA